MSIKHPVSGKSSHDITIYPNMLNNNKKYHFYLPNTEWATRTSLDSDENKIIISFEADFSPRAQFFSLMKPDENNYINNQPYDISKSNYPNNIDDNLNNYPPYQDKDWKPSYISTGGNTTGYDYKTSIELNYTKQDEIIMDNKGIYHYKKFSDLYRERNDNSSIYHINFHFELSQMETTPSPQI